MRVALSFGGNIGSVEATFHSAIRRLRNSQIELLQKSALYRTEPWGYESTNKFLNQVILIETNLELNVLLDLCLETEEELGRQRSDEKGYRDRKIDIDILWAEKRVVDHPDLKVPHPELPNRKFVLLPLAELIPEEVHPIYHSTFKQLLDNCEDATQIAKV